MNATTSRIEFLERSRNEIHAFIDGYLAEKSSDLLRATTWGTDVAHRLERFTAGGKMLRGGLVLLAHDMFGGVERDAALATAAALELFQSAFLIHDDIMDRDELRRGRETVFQQYARLGAEQGVADARHFGESMGICAGDVALFCAFEILANLATDPARRGTVLGLVARELSYVGAAQMQDVHLGSTRVAVDDSTVVNLYRYKTGRYTFSLPLMLGAILAGQPNPVLAKLSALGEKLGILFQIKDDEIGLFGDAAETGKPEGSDVAEGKKTLIYLSLMTTTRSEQRERLIRIFGNRALRPEDLEYVRTLVEELGIRAQLRGEMERMAAEAEELIRALPPTSASGADVMEALVSYNLSRTA